MINHQCQSLWPQRLLESTCLATDGGWSPGGPAAGAVGRSWIPHAHRLKCLEDECSRFSRLWNHIRDSWHVVICYLSKARLCTCGETAFLASGEPCNPPRSQHLILPFLSLSCLFAGLLCAKRCPRLQGCCMHISVCREHVSISFITLYMPAVFT